MSRMINHECDCPVCGQGCTLSLYASVNVTLYPEERETVLSRRVFLQRCPVCGAEFELRHPLLYHDMDKKFMVYLLPGDEDVPELESPGDLFRYRLRRVNKINALLEKIQILEQKRDDRVIEVMKTYMEQVIATTQPDFLLRDILYEWREDRESFLCYSDQTVGVMAFPEESYGAIEAELSPHWDNKGDLRFQQIDREWVRLIMGEA